MVTVNNGVFTQALNAEVKEYVVDLTMDSGDTFDTTTIVGNGNTMSIIASFGDGAHTIQVANSSGVLTITDSAGGFTGRQVCVRMLVAGAKDTL